MLTPKKGESKSDFVSRCMGDSVMNKEWPEQKQRAGVCYSQWEKKRAKAAYVIQAGDEEYIVPKEDEKPSPTSV